MYEAASYIQPWLNNVFVHHNVHQPCTSTTMSINHVNVHYNQRCYRYQVNNKIITYIIYQEKECTDNMYQKNVPKECTDKKCTDNRMYRQQECTASYLKKKYIYERQEEEILNNLLLVSLTRTEYEYRCVFQQFIYFMHH